MPGISGTSTARRRLEAGWRRWTRSPSTPSSAARASGSQRLAGLAGAIAPLVGADPALARRAALLCKADLATGMVGEFPELQGVMGRYYALHDGEDAGRRRRHPRPLRARRGRAMRVPPTPVSMRVALADKLDMLAAFFGIGEKPTGSGDPYALRRAALGIIRIIRENGAAG